jgi:hypothetical protein
VPASSSTDTGVTPDTPSRSTSSAEATRSMSSWAEVQATTWFTAGEQSRPGCRTSPIRGIRDHPRYVSSGRSQISLIVG